MLGAGLQFARLLAPTLMTLMILIFLKIKSREGPEEYLVITRDYHTASLG